MDCSHTLKSDTRQIDLDQSIKFLEAGALCQSPTDWSEMNTELEQACLLLGKHCTYELKKTIQTINNLIKK